LHAFAKHGTVEIRGFTKKNSDHMGIDPNMVVRDLVFLQDVLTKTMESMKGVLLSGAAPTDPLSVQPGPGWKETIDDYTQDIFLLEIIHALGQKENGKRRKTMEAILRDKEHITPGILKKLDDSERTIMTEDALGRHFLSVLRGETEWNPGISRTRLSGRKRSLRSMSDAAFASRAEPVGASRAIGVPSNPGDGAHA
jgi:hypothetical protein